MKRQQVRATIQSVARCTWCDAPIDTENSLSKLCDDCSEADSKQIEQDEARERAYWRHVDQKIDEARGK